MSRTYEVYLHDIVEAIDHIESYVQDISKPQIEIDRMRYDTVIRNLEVIGEAVKKIPASIREDYSYIAWRK